MQFKKFFAVLPALALSTAMVVAQEPQPTTTQTPQTSVGQPTDTNEPLFKGCVSGTKDNYILTTSDGKTFRLHSDKDIAEHVGKMVEIRGTVKKEGADRPADAAPASATSEMDVADLKDIEGSCPADNSGAAASADMPKSDAATADAAAADTTAAPATEEQKATVTEPSANAAVSTETPAASAEAKVEATPEPSANAAVSTDTTANQATDTTSSETTAAPAATEQNVQADSAQLPETASPLPLLGLLGFASMGLGLITRRK
jgi:hypothetical protein